MGDELNTGLGENVSEAEAIDHSVSRTITEYDNILFTLLTNNNNQIHFNRIRGEESEFGQCLVNSTLTLAVVTGLTVQDLSKDGINLGWEKISLPRPVFPGDTISARSRILSERPSKSRPGQVIVRVQSEGMNQSGDVVLRYVRNILRPD